MPRKLPENPEYYSEIPSGYRVRMEGFMVEPMIYQPTIKGMAVLAEHYRKKYDIDIRIVDQSATGIPGDYTKSRLGEFKRFLAAHGEELEADLEDGKQIGLILCHNANHSIPLVMSRDDERKTVLTFFDSLAAGQVNNYRFAATELFPEYTVLLNQGTRQADRQSCMADSVAILKDALRMRDLAQHILDHKIVAKSSSDSDSDDEVEGSKETNFKLFRMPEELLKTAQVSEFFAKAEPDPAKIITAGGKSLEEKRDASKIAVTIHEKGVGEAREIPVNSYLHTKSRRFAEIICEELGIIAPTTKAEAAGAAGSGTPPATLRGGGSAASASSGSATKTH
jgi:hypothetical protein